MANLKDDGDLDITKQSHGAPKLGMEPSEVKFANEGSQASVLSGARNAFVTSISNAERVIASRDASSNSPIGFFLLGLQTIGAMLHPVFPIIPDSVLAGPGELGDDVSVQPSIDDAEDLKSGFSSMTGANLTGSEGVREKSILRTELPTSISSEMVEFDGRIARKYFSLDEVEERIKFLIPDPDEAEIVWNTITHEPFRKVVDGWDCFVNDVELPYLGIAQFKRSTWRSVMGREPFSNAIFLDETILATYRLMKADKRTFERQGFTGWTKEIAYLYHNQGAGSAAKILRGDSSVDYSNQSKLAQESFDSLFGSKANSYIA